MTDVRCTCCSATAAACEVWRAAEGFAGCCSGCNHDPAKVSESTRFYRAYDAAVRREARVELTPVAVRLLLEERRPPNPSTTD